MSYDDERARIIEAWKPVSEQKPHAWSMFLVSGGFFIANVLRLEDPAVMLGMITLAGIIAGAIWLWHIHSKYRAFCSRLRQVDKHYEQITQTK